MYTYSVIPSTYDATRPWAVVCDQKVLNPVKGRFETQAKAKARAAALRRRAAAQ